MHDVHTGTFGVVAVVSVLAMKFAGIAALPASLRFESLVLAPCLARLAMVAAIAAFPYARSQGVGASFHELAWPRPALIAGGTALVASVALLGANGVYVVAFAVACGLALGAVGRQLAGGMTGDLYGATLELSEASLLLFLAAFAARGWLTAWLLR
jgi:adenosylcobinamide-GDP ribazoletransferase